MGKPRSTLERRQLGAELRRLREAAAKQQKDAADTLECDMSQISRVESGERAFKVLEIEKLLDFYAAPTETRAQITKLAKIARQRQPRRMHSDALPGAFRRLSDHEHDATEIYYSESELIPGLLQTEDYIRSLMRVGRSALFDASSDDIEARVQFRLERQGLLTRSKPPEVWFVIGEAALCRPLGQQSVLLSQLRHLLTTIDTHSHVVVQVAPLSIMDHPLLGGSLQILRYGGLVPDVVHQPSFIGGGVYLTEPQDISECMRAFDRLRAVALGPQDSRAFIAQRLEELEHD